MKMLWRHLDYEMKKHEGPDIDFDAFVHTHLITYWYTYVFSKVNITATCYKFFSETPDKNGNLLPLPPTPDESTVYPARYFAEGMLTKEILNLHFSSPTSEISTDPKILAYTLVFCQLFSNLCLLLLQQGSKNNKTFSIKGKKIIRQQLSESWINPAYNPLYVTTVMEPKQMVINPATWRAIQQLYQIDTSQDSPTYFHTNHVILKLTLEDREEIFFDPTHTQFLNSTATDTLIKPIDGTNFVIGDPNLYKSIAPFPDAARAFNEIKNDETWDTRLQIWFSLFRPVRKIPFPISLTRCYSSTASTS